MDIADVVYSAGIADKVIDSDNAAMADIIDAAVVSSLIIVSDKIICEAAMADTIIAGMIIGMGTAPAWTVC